MGVLNDDDEHQLKLLIDNVYNNLAVLEGFCQNNFECEKICNVSPLVNQLKDDADSMYRIICEI